ncbi:MAG: flagellar hook-length control protein FliK, partial [Giesbergeria sp.]
ASVGHLAAGGLVAQTARMDAASENMSGNGALGALAQAPSPTRRGPGIALATQFRTAKLAPDQAARYASEASGAAIASTATDHRTVPDSGQLQQVLQKVAEGAQVGASQSMDAAALAPTAVAAGALTAETRTGRTEFLAQERPGSLGGSMAALADAGSPPTLEAGGMPPDGVATSPEEAVAEQVTYWLSENLKNAELTVDHEGQPVEVRVSLVGNEAHVAFRSEQAQTRALLDARMDDLRELLRGEGLVLSGTSVDSGASGQRGQDGDRPSPGGVRTARVMATTDSHDQVVRRYVTNNSVDLYV